MTHNYMNTYYSKTNHQNGLSVRFISHLICNNFLQNKISFFDTSLVCTCTHTHTHTHSISWPFSNISLAFAHTHTHTYTHSVSWPFSGISRICTHTHTHTHTHSLSILTWLFSLVVVSCFRLLYHPPSPLFPPWAPLLVPLLKEKQLHHWNCMCNQE